MSVDLKDKIILVTGASRGVGKGAALGLAESGATIYITGRTSKPGESEYTGSLQQTIDEIDEIGGIGHARVCNHSNDAEVEKVIEDIIEQHGRLDLLVNNVFSLPADLTLWSQASFWEQPISMWDDQINIGLRSHYVASVFAARHMLAKKSGLIVNISSPGAEEYHMNVAYGVGKAGLDKLSSDVAHELQEHNVCCLSIWPGLVSTERITNELGTEGLESMGFETPTFTGRAIAALLADSEIMTKTGGRYLVCDLAKEYGFTDINGKIPDAHAYSNN